MTTSAVDPEVLPDPTVEEVGDGLFAYVQPDGTWCINNTGFLVDAHGVTAIDTCATERRSRRFLDAVAAITDRPIRTLVNTHSHIDHTYGNWLLPEATIVGHEECRRDLLEAGFSARAAFAGIDFGHAEVAPPTLTFDTSLRLWVGDRPVELHHTGPAHTTSDVYAWVPDERVLYAGDLLFNGGTPFVMMGSVAGSLAALEELRALEPARIVPGHGPVAGPELIDRVAAYLRFVQQLAADAASSGITALEAARRADLGEFSAWHDRERLVGNLHRALAERAGAPPGAALDIAAIWAEMLDFNGGRPLRCLA